MGGGLLKLVSTVKIRPVPQQTELDRMAEELRTEFRIKFGVCEAEHAMARELILLQLELRDKLCKSFFRGKLP